MLRQTSDALEKVSAVFLHGVSNTGARGRTPPLYRDHEFKKGSGQSYLGDLVQPGSFEVSGLSKNCLDCVKKL